MNKLKRVIIASIIVALSSQISIGFLGTDFRVSGGIIFLAILLFLYKDLKPIQTGIVSGICVYLLRALLYYLGNGSFNEVLWSFKFEILFYTFYGIIYSLFSKKNTIDNINQLLLAMIVGDFCSNIIEVWVRVTAGVSQLNPGIITTLFLVAIVRSCIVWLILNGLKYYKMLLLKEEHEKRYRRLLWLTAQLKTEMYWMEKNMDNIEKVMSNSYGLFEKIKLDNDKENWADRAVTIARDVHEIKKEYELVLRGMREITENKLQDEGMNFKEIMNILYESMKREVVHKKKNIELHFETGDNFYTSKHYYLMSILRNLIMNGIDSIPDSKEQFEIKLIHNAKEGKHVFIVTDTGVGVEEKNLNHIFSPGFSTKINYTTGEINRGLGLSVVKEIVENHFNGEITVNSEKGKGTTFWVHIPKEYLEV